MTLTADTNCTPIRITGTTSTDTQIIPKGQLIYVKYVYWYNPTTTGHLCHLTDGSGKSIIKMRAETDGDTQMWPLGIKFDGLRIDDMDSGTLYIYHP